MRGDFDEDEDDYCIDCGGEGWVVTCIDDICHGLGYCIHGDGMRICHCNRDLDKIAPSNAPANWRFSPRGKGK